MPDDIKPQETDMENQPVQPGEPAPQLNSESQQAAQDVKPAPETQPPAEAAEAPRPASEQAGNHPDIPKPAQQHEEHHIIPIILALILLILLAAIAIIGGDKINKKNTSRNGSTSQSVQTEPVQTQDRQTLNDAIRSINSLSTEDDTSGQGLSNQSLGL